MLDTKESLAFFYKPTHLEKFMLGKLLKTTAKVAAAVVFVEDEKIDDEEQLDMLDDGLGNVIADREHMTQQEAEDAQSRGELYDTYY